jgi:alkylation response protein AidB-like acyl-CoA dehydrogenase
VDLRLTDEQRQLQETVARYLRDTYTFEHRRAIQRSPAGWSRETWRVFADLGLLAVGTPESHGGLGGTAMDTMLVLEEFGRSLVLEPYVSSAVIGAATLARHGSGAVVTELLPRVLSGDITLGFAHEEPGSRYELERVTTRAATRRGVLSLHGSKSGVIHGATVDRLLVSAREDNDDERDPQRVSLFVIARDTEGVTITDYPTHDGLRAADVRLDGVAVTDADRVGERGGAQVAIEQAIQHAIVAHCAEAVGAMSALIDITTGYLKTRKQFGVPIGTFQALQHRMADLLMRLEQARSMALLAAAKVDSSERAERRRVVSAAKSLVGSAARLVGQQAVQLHGGIGVTDEADVSHYFKRLTMIDAAYGDAEHHLARYSDSMLE